MALNSTSLTHSATAIAYTPTGGTAVGWAISSSSGDKVVLSPNTDTDYRIKRFWEFTKSTPKIQTDAPNGYTQVRIKCLGKFPKTLANGKVTVNTVKVEFAYDIETSTADRLELRSMVAQLVTNANLIPVLDAQAMG